MPEKGFTDKCRYTSPLDRIPFSALIGCSKRVRTWMNEDPKWFEVAVFHPAVYILIGIIMIGIVIYANFK